MQSLDDNSELIRVKHGQRLPFPPPEKPVPVVALGADPLVRACTTGCAQCVLHSTGGVLSAVPRRRRQRREPRQVLPRWHRVPTQRPRQTSLFLPFGEPMKKFRHVDAGFQESLVHVLLAPVESKLFEERLQMRRIHVHPHFGEGRLQLRPRQTQLFLHPATLTTTIALALAAGCGGQGLLGGGTVATGQGHGAESGRGRVGVDASAL
mmetsp:Transcript_42962/g.114912  ORF Transcript_42962/g.114912 Transcript_42962/m.114912 type:complete len:208 (-) Transcript_42962:619-1242(-)